MEPEVLTPEQRVEALLKKLNDELSKGQNAVGEKIDAHKRETDAALAEIRADLERKRSAFSLPGSGDATNREGKKFQFGMALKGVMTGNWAGAEMEKEIMVQATEKAATTFPESAGGFMVPIEVLENELIPKLDASSVVTQMGATVMRGLRSMPTLIPRVTGGTTAYWIGGETGSITESQMTGNQMRLQPKILAVLAPYSDLLGNVGVPGFESMLQRDMALRLALKQDLAALNGGGGSEPIGIMQTTGVNTNSVSTPTYNELVDHIAEMEYDNALMGNLGWVLSAQAKNAIVKMVDTANQELQRRVLSSGPLTELLGYKYATTTQLSATTDMIFGNWADLVIGQWGGLMLATTNAVGFASLTSHVRMHLYTDLGVRHAESFVIHA